MVFGIESSILFFIVFIVIYLLIFLYSNKLFISDPNCHWAEAHIGSVRKCIEIEQEAPEHENPREKKIRETNNELLKEAKELVDKSKKYLFFWDASLVLAAWNKIHEAKRHAVWIMPPALVSARLKRAMGELNELQKEKKDVWQTTLEDIQNKDVNDEGRAILNQFLADLYYAREGSLAILANLKNKITRLSMIGLILMTIFGLAGYSFLLLAGMVGGLLSRMQRVLTSKQVLADYGAYWAPLFISPIFGGLAALAGMFLVLFLRDMNVLAIDTIKSNLLKEPTPNMLGIAVLFGISERLIDKLVEQAKSTFIKMEKKIES